MAGPTPRPADERFWEKVAKSDGCWLWTASLDKRGYGQFGVGTRERSKTVRAHRFAYEDAVGPIPEGLTLDHLCGQHACVRPSHLEPVTTQINTRRWADTITHCPQGHEYTEANLVKSKTGWRGCRECANARQREKQYWRVAT